MVTLMQIMKSHLVLLNNIQYGAYSAYTSL